MNSFRTSFILLLLLGTASAVSQKGTVLRFNSPSANVTIPDRTDLNFSGDFTIEMWLWAASHTPPFSNIIEKQDNVYSLYMTPEGKINAAIGTATQFVELTSTAVLQTGIWYHLALVYNSKLGLLRLFLDGKPLGATNVSPPEPIAASTKELIIGGSTMSAAPFHGYIDEVRLSSVIRYTQDFDPKAPFVTDTNTVALFHFDEGSGNTAGDASRKGHQGTVSGATWSSLPLAVNPLSRPERPSLGANHPNPFSASTEFTLSIPAGDFSGASLQICNALGQKVADYSAALQPGENRIAVSGASLPRAGMYLCVLRTVSGTVTRRLVKLQ